MNFYAIRHKPSQTFHVGGSRSKWFIFDSATQPKLYKTKQSAFNEIKKCLETHNKNISSGHRGQPLLLSGDLELVEIELIVRSVLNTI